MDISTGVAALVGTVVGGGITIVGAWLQQKQVTEREFVKLATELANKEMDLLRAQLKPNQKLQPLESFITYYIKYVKLIKKGDLDISDLKELRAFRVKLLNFYDNEFSPQ